MNATRAAPGSRNRQQRAGPKEAAAVTPKSAARAPPAMLAVGTADLLLSDANAGTELFRCALPTIRPVSARGDPPSDRRAGPT
jgi:hypothetical protein